MALRSERYRYIRYVDGSEEFYDHQMDPHEWTNLASSAGVEELMKQHARQLPKNARAGAREWLDGSPIV